MIGDLELNEIRGQPTPNRKLTCTCRTQADHLEEERKKTCVTVIDFEFKSIAVPPYINNSRIQWHGRQRHLNWWSADKEMAAESVVSEQGNDKIMVGRWLYMASVVRLWCYASVEVSAVQI